MFVKTDKNPIRSFDTFGEADAARAKLVQEFTEAGTIDQHRVRVSFRSRTEKYDLVVKTKVDQSKGK